MIAGQHLLGMRGMDAATIYGILATAKGFKENSRRKMKKVPSLRGRTSLNVCYENSTRTRVSFELAAVALVLGPFQPGLGWAGCVAPGGSLGAPRPWSLASSLASIPFSKRPASLASAM